MTGKIGRGLAFRFTGAYLSAWWRSIAAMSFILAAPIATAMVGNSYNGDPSNVLLIILAFGLGLLVAAAMVRVLSIVLVIPIALLIGSLVSIWFMWQTQQGNIVTTRQLRDAAVQTGSVIIPAMLTPLALFTGTAFIPVVVLIWLWGAMNGYLLFHGTQSVCTWYVTQLMGKAKRKPKPDYAMAA